MHLAASFILALMLGLYLVAGLSVTGLGGPDGRAVARVNRVDSTSPALKMALPPAPEPLRFRAIPAADALALNAAVPVSSLPNPAAKPFAGHAASGIDATRSLDCLTAAVYYEAASEGADGQRAVAQVVLNRVRHPAYPKTVCGVVFQGSTRATGCQFTFTCDGALARVPVAGLWKQSRAIAQAALGGAVFKPVGYATHYHTNWVVPYWSSSLVKAANIGSHIFYRWTGGWGRAGAFQGRYAGVEPQISLKPGSAQPAATADGAEVNGLIPVPAEDPADGASMDSFQRAVLRRYEPATRDGVATLLDKQTQPGETVETSYRWALTGAAPEGRPLGTKAPEASGAAPATAK